MRVDCMFLEPSYRIVNHDLARRIEFADGEKLEIRIRMQNHSALAGYGLRDISRTMNSAAATMTWLWATSITPHGPQVFACNFSTSRDDNPVGHPYILCSYMGSGMPATAIRVSTALLDPNKKAAFRKAVAKLQLSLTLHPADVMGSLYFKEHDPKLPVDPSQFNPNQVEVGPDICTGLGPWKLASDYYDVLELILIEKGRGVQKLREIDSFVLPSRLRYLMGFFQKPSSLIRTIFHGTTKLSLPNLWVDENLQILRIYDMGSVRFAPAEIAVQFPLMRDLGLAFDREALLPFRGLV